MADKTIGIQIGGVDGPVGEQLVAALAEALATAVSLGQNQVAQTIATVLGNLGHANSIGVHGANLSMPVTQYGAKGD